VKIAIDDLLAGSHNILNKWKNNFSQLLNVHRVSDVRQIAIHRAEPLIPDPSPFNVETNIAKLKIINCQVVIKFLQKIQVGSETLQSEIHKLINSTWRKEELSDQWKESTIVPVLHEE
jgi:hypothetical protein